MAGFVNKFSTVLLLVILVLFTDIGYASDSDYKDLEEISKISILIKERKFSEAKISSKKCIDKYSTLLKTKIGDEFYTRDKMTLCMRLLGQAYYKNGEGLENLELYKAIVEEDKKLSLEGKAYFLYYEDLILSYEINPDIEQKEWIKMLKMALKDSLKEGNYLGANLARFKLAVTLNASSDNYLEIESLLNDYFKDYPKAIQPFGEKAMGKLIVEYSHVSILQISNYISQKKYEEAERRIDKVRQFFDENNVALEVKNYLSFLKIVVDYAMVDMERDSKKFIFTNEYNKFLGEALENDYIVFYKSEEILNFFISSVSTNFDINPEASEAYLTSLLPSIDNFEPTAKIFIYTELGDIHFKNGKYEDAKASYEAALKIAKTETAWAKKTIDFIQSRIELLKKDDMQIDFREPFLNILF